MNSPTNPSIRLFRLLDEVVVTPPTIGANVEEVAYKNLKFLCWDIGGQNALRQTWVNYFADTDVRFFPLVDHFPPYSSPQFDLIHRFRLSCMW